MYSFMLSFSCALSLHLGLLSRAPPSVCRYGESLGGLLRESGARFKGMAGAWGAARAEALRDCAAIRAVCLGPDARPTLEAAREATTRAF